MIERMLGTDALLWHLETPDIPVHTLKTAVIDPARLGRPVTLHDLKRGLAPRLGLVRRATQRVMAAPLFAGRPFWVPDPGLDLDLHFDEVDLDPPGDRAALDRLHSRLAEKHLDRDRPLWAVTLANGLDGGRQAVVVRIHHAVTDGGGALNALVALTSEKPGQPIPTAPAPAHRSGDTPVSWTTEGREQNEWEGVSRAALLRRVIQESPRLVGRLGPMVVDATRSAVRARRFRRAHPDLPPFLGSERSFANQSHSGGRICASTDLPFESFRRIARGADVTVNGVYHALIAAAMRDEMARRHELDRPCVAAFGIAATSPDPERTHGNHVTPTNVRLFTDLDDPLDRLRQTGRSCREGVELRRVTGVEMAGRWSDYTCRLAAWIAHAGADRLPRIVNHVTTANVAGPDHHRWAGPVEVVDWISFAIAVHPSNINVTAYSYAGRMSVGLVTVPEILPRPDRFLERMREELTTLELAVDSTH